ncbi:hypothetical protein IKF81_03635 [Candidatus Saccharibacteria bacterium]|nr:hypothetical protein [Candidatus Saccharibacteria bacterium]
MKKTRKIFSLLLATFVAVFGMLSKQVFAGMDFSVAPMNQKIILTPGENYTGTFEIINPEYNPGTFYYKLSAEPFFVDENYQPVYKNNGDYNQIVDWIELDDEEGSVEPNETSQINFTIHVPKTAPAGGQYAIIRIASDEDKYKSEETNGLSVQSIPTIAHILYAEVAGETRRSGEIVSTSVPSFLFSGNISGTTTIKNTGNVHSDATYTLQVFPFFSKEEVYTNEENPVTSTILPGATRTTSVSWDSTPKIGVFHVIYNADFEGVESKVDKYVIVCPLWLLFILLACLFVVIFSIIFARKKSDKKA